MGMKDVYWHCLCQLWELEIANYIGTEMSREIVIQTDLVKPNQKFHQLLTIPPRFPAEKVHPLRIDSLSICINGCSWQNSSQNSSTSLISCLKFFWDVIYDL